MQTDLLAPANRPVPSEHRRLQPLLAPQSIVIVGASPNPDRIGGLPIENLVVAGFPSEKLLLVNPKYTDIRGQKCFPSVNDLPWVPDLAVLAVRASETLPVLQQCHARGIRAAILFAAGFAEARDSESQLAQQAITDFASATGMQIAGPNCVGLANVHSRAYPSFMKNLSLDIVPGPIAVIAQSGNMIAVLRNAGLRASLGFSHLINTGNEACVELSEYLEYLAEDPQVGAVLAYVEQVRDGARFLKVAQRMRSLGKPLFMLKVGSSLKGAEAAASHTAALSGSHAAYDAAFRQLGIPTVNDPYRLIDLATLWKTGRRTKARRACVVSLSGAGCALMADLLAKESVELPSLPAHIQTKLQSVVPSFGMVSNPVDLTGQVTNDGTFVSTVLAAIDESPDMDSIVLYVMGTFLDGMAPELIRLAQASEKLIVVVDTSVFATCHPALRGAGIAVFSDMSRAAAALGHYLRWNEPVAPWNLSAAPPTIASISAPEVRRARSEARVLLSEVEAKQWLGRAGLPMVVEHMASDAEQAAELAAKVGFPVAMKIVSPDIAHKSEVGGVLLNVADVSQARQAFVDLQSNVRQLAPAARIDGVVVQPMIGATVPVLIGVLRDAVFGPSLTVGLGGVMTELLQDAAMRLLPINEAIAREMVNELRGAALLRGFRGAPVADADALVSLMVALSDFMLREGHDIEELELNPVQVQQEGKGVLAVDALVRLRVA